MYLALQVLASEAGVVEVAAGVAVVVADMATVEVAGAEMVGAAVMVAVCTACKALHKDTPTVKIRHTAHCNRSHRKLGQIYLCGWLADDMGLINIGTLRDDHCSGCGKNFHSWSRYTQE